MTHLNITAVNSKMALRWVLAQLPIKASLHAVRHAATAHRQAQAWRDPHFHYDLSSSEEVRHGSLMVFIQDTL